MMNTEQTETLSLHFSVNGSTVVAWWPPPITHILYVMLDFSPRIELAPRCTVLLSLPPPFVGLKPVFVVSVIGNVKASARNFKYSWKPPSHPPVLNYARPFDFCPFYLHVWRETLYESIYFLVYFFIYSPPLRACERWQYRALPGGRRNGE